MSTVERTYAFYQTEQMDDVTYLGSSINIQWTIGRDLNYNVWKASAAFNKLCEKLEQQEIYRATKILFLQV